VSENGRRSIGITTIMDRRESRGRARTPHVIGVTNECIELGLGDCLVAHLPANGTFRSTEPRAEFASHVFMGDPSGQFVGGAWTRMFEKANAPGYSYWRDRCNN
jgi:hypothetical protein